MFGGVPRQARSAPASALGVCVALAGLAACRAPAEAPTAPPSRVTSSAIQVQPSAEPASAAPSSAPSEATPSAVGGSAPGLPASAALAADPAAAQPPAADAGTAADGDAPTAEAPAADQPWPTAAAAVIARPRETILLSRDGQSRVVGPAAEWCQSDARRGLVWLRTADDTLTGIDLWAGGAPQPLTGPVPSGAPIWFFDGERHVPEVDEQGDDVGLEVGLTATPVLRPRTICEGDRSFYCYVDGDPDKGLEPELARRLTRLEALRLYPGGITWLSARAARPARSATQPPPAAPRMKIDRSPCTESPEDCGTGLRVPGTNWARIEVGNSRGDFYHRDVALLDLGNSRMRHPDDPERIRRSDEPVDDFLIGRFDVAPDGGAWLTTDYLVDAATRRAIPHGGRVCGWWQPAPIVKNP